MDVSARPTTTADDWLCQCRYVGKVKGRMHDMLSASQRRFREMITLAEVGDERVLQMNSMAHLDVGDGSIRSVADTIREGLAAVPSLDYFDASVLEEEDPELRRMLERAAELKGEALDRSASETTDLQSRIDRLAAIEGDLSRARARVAAARRRRPSPYPSTHAGREPGSAQNRSIKSESGTSAIDLERTRVLDRRGSIGGGDLERTRVLDRRGST